MLGQNKCVFMGTVATEPFMTYTKHGDAKTTFKIKILEDFQGRSRTTWVPLVLWRELAETAAESLEDGHEIQVMARFSTWQRDGTNVCEACNNATERVIYNDEFEVQQFEIIGVSKTNVAEEIDPEDLPF